MNDIGKYLADMDRREFWKLVRKHRPWLTRREAAALLGRSVRCLEVWWAQGKGPTPVIRRRFVCYHIDVLDAWMLSKIEPSSASGGHSVSQSKAVV